MTALAAGAVDWDSLGKVVVAALIAGVGVTFCFSLAVAGATRFAERRRNHRNGEAILQAVVGLAGLAATIASVVIGIVVMTKKS
jgi:predicted RND superfamily exporter protein